MRTRRAAMTLALSSLFPYASSFAANTTHMVKAVSDHFELYTTDSDAAANAALTHFETVRSYVLHAFHTQDPFGASVRLVGFKSAGEYGQFTPDNGDLVSRAFSEAGVDRVTIVMATLKKEDYQYGVREYVTAFLNKIAPTMPYWLRTGFAELYSTVREENGQIKLGSEPAREFQHEITRNFNMEVMFTLDGGISRNKGALDFYSDSLHPLLPDAKVEKEMENLEATSTVDYPVLLWQLTHMLMFKKEYSPKFGAFVQAACQE